MSIHEDETKLKAEAVAPRVSAEDLEGNIAATEIVQTVTAGGQILRWAVLTTKNGFAVTGDPSAAVSAENDNPELGIKYATENAKRKLWVLMAYELKSRTALLKGVGAPKGSITEFSHLATYVGTKVVHAVPMTRAAYNVLRGWDLPQNENGDDAGFLVEYTDGGAPNVQGFAGYISWSPQDVFDRAYKKSANEASPQKNDYIGRMQVEEADLLKKLVALRTFIDTNPIYGTLPSVEQHDMKNQLHGMDTYYWHLLRRIQRAQAAAL